VVLTEPLTPEAAARLLFENGPLTKAEIKKLSKDKALEYFETMNHFLKELGPEQFVARREELREGTFRKIINRGSPKT
jgi:hypothetical protein